MLAMREVWSFKKRMSDNKGGEKEKLGLVEFDGVNSTKKRNASMLRKDYEINRVISSLGNYFCYEGKINEQKCQFKIDTGSEVSILNRKFSDGGEEKISIKTVSEVSYWRKGTYKVSE